MNQDHIIFINALLWLLTDLFIGRRSVAQVAIGTGRNIAFLGLLTTFMQYVALIAPFFLIGWKYGITLVILEVTILTFISSKFDNWFQRNPNLEVFSKILVYTKIMFTISAGLTLYVLKIIN